MPPEVAFLFFFSFLFVFKAKKNKHVPSAFVAGGFLVAQFVLMLRLPNHLPFIAAMALSAS